MLSSEPRLDNIIYRVEHLFRRSGGSGGSGPPGHRDRGDRACFRPSRLILRGGRRELVDSVGHRLEFDASELRNDGRLPVGVQAPTLYFVDVLDQLLEETRARGAVFRQALLDPPWGLRFESGAALTSVAMVRSDAWLVPDGAPAVRIGAGDIAIVNGPGPFTLVDRPGTGPSHLVTADTYCAGTGGVDLGRSLALGARACGVGFDAAAAVLSGAYGRTGGISERLRRALPPVLVVADDACQLPLLGLIASETLHERRGQQVVLDRLLELLLVSALRSWFDRPGTEAPAWYRAIGDPVVDRALRLLHDAPEEPWTVAKLAAKCGVSRASLARRFTAEVGEPPMTYLTNWRIAWAADLLAGSDDTVGAIARRVGYGDVYALSAAFKRLRGLTPTEHRTTSRG